MSNSKHSVARRGEWPTQEMQCDVRPASPLYLCTLHTPASMKDTRSRLNSEPAQDNSEESAKQKQTRDDQFLLRFISDHHTNNGWVEENSNAAYLSWKMLRVFLFYFYTRKFLCTCKKMNVTTNFDVIYKVIAHWISQLAGFFLL